jgi:hypothetical protein
MHNDQNLDKSWYLIQIIQRMEKPIPERRIFIIG